MIELSPSEEKKLHETKYAAWVEYVAPRWIKRARERPDLKAQMWQASSPLLRKAIRTLIEAEKSST